MKAIKNSYILVILILIIALQAKAEVYDCAWEEAKRCDAVIKEAEQVIELCTSYAKVCKDQNEQMAAVLLGTVQENEKLKNPQGLNDPRNAGILGLLIGLLIGMIRK